MNRRTFIRNSGICAGTACFSSLLISKMTMAETGDFNFLGPDFNKPIDLKLRIKPICSARVHKEAYHGPCRYAPLEELTTAAERQANEAGCEGFMKNLLAIQNTDAEIFPPAIVDFPEGDMIDPSFFNQLEKEIQDIDLFVITYRVPGLEHFKKPVAMVGQGVTNVDIAAYYRDRGLEGYAPYLWDDFSELITVLKTRKALNQTRILILTNRLDKPPYGVYTSISDFEHLQDKYGVSCQSVSLEEFYVEMETILNNKQFSDEIKAKTEKFVKDAKSVHMKTDTIASDICFYAAAANMLKKYHANAFAARCFELCASRVPWEKKFVPCSALSLFKDQGIPASCEGDISALMAMAVEMYLAKKSIYMGNPLVEKDKSLLTIHHDVPGLKMKGFDQPDLPYSIVNFTDSGFGATIRYDFANDTGQPVTLGRFHRSGDKMLLTGGIIDGSFDVLKYGCSLGIKIRMENIMDYYENSKDFGHHLAMVYGDYSAPIKRLGKVMGFEVVT